MSRALRRHHRQRLKKVRRFHWSHDRHDPMSAKVLSQVVDTPKRCALECCQNPRWAFGETTQQERRFYAEAVDDLIRDESLHALLQDAS